MNPSAYPNIIDMKQSGSEVEQLEVDGLKIDFALDNALFNRHYVRAVNDVSFSIKAGEA